MKQVRWLLIVFIGLTLCAFAAVYASDSPSRYIKDGVFVSEANPPLRIKVDDHFTYAGSIDFILKEAARVDRHYWVDADGTEIRAMVVLQFEGYLDGVEGSYHFSVPARTPAGGDYRFSPEPVRLGNHKYVHNTWAFNHAANARENPGNESDRTIKFLTAKGYRLDDELIMSRFVRAVGTDSRNELIIFYMEPLRLHGHSLTEFPDGGPVSETYDRLSALLTKRSLSAIEVLESGN